jgi:hypothetical protein
MVHGSIGERAERGKGPPRSGTAPFKIMGRPAHPGADGRPTGQRVVPTVCRVSIIFCADSSMSMTSESIRDTK